ncbi:hypothetical protein [Cohnella sp.]|uniref:hypothetical protein n=1 Tax=Cohnella sp. TaxID=1883426 RepID=UPI003563A810
MRKRTIVMKLIQITGMRDNYEKNKRKNSILNRRRRYHNNGTVSSEQEVRRLAPVS